MQNLGEEYRYAWSYCIFNFFNYPIYWSLQLNVIIFENHLLQKCCGLLFIITTVFAPVLGDRIILIIKRINFSIHNAMSIHLRTIYKIYIYVLYYLIHHLPTSADH